MREGKIYEGDILIMEAFQDATLDNGMKACEACLFELITDGIRSPKNATGEYEEVRVKLNKVFSGDAKEYKIYVQDPRNPDITRKIDFGRSAVRTNGNGKPRKFKTVHKCGHPSGAWSCLKNS
jgi:hypothetical protein